MIISIGVPVRERTRFIGAMYYDLELTPLAELVNRVNLFDAGYLFIVTEKGNTIAHPNASYNGQALSSYLPQVALQEGMRTVELEGRPYLVYFSEVPNENWYVGAIVDESQAFSALSKLRNSSIIYTFIGVVISIIGLTILINFLIRPLGLLNNAIQDMASGQGDLTKRLNTNTDKEFAELAYGWKPCKNRFSNPKRLVRKLCEELSKPCQVLRVLRRQCEINCKN